MGDHDQQEGSVRGPFPKSPEWQLKDEDAGRTLLALNLATQDQIDEARQLRESNPKFRDSLVHEILRDQEVIGTHDSKRVDAVLPRLTGDLKQGLGMMGISLEDGIREIDRVANARMNPNGEHSEMMAGVRAANEQMMEDMLRARTEDPHDLEPQSREGRDGRH